MKFTELESIMFSRGITTLADIARALNTTPQAVSNWKARDQVPYHIVAKINQMTFTDNAEASPQFTDHHSPFSVVKDTISISDILVLMAEQLKVILLVPFIMTFLTFTYVQFIQQPQYVSSATILFPDNRAKSLGGLSGLASLYGVSVPSGPQADLSSPSLLPELLRSRTFAEKILEKEFFSEQYNKNLSLLAILTIGDEKIQMDKNILISAAIIKFNKMVGINRIQNSTGGFEAINALTVTAPEPLLSKQLADVVLTELEALHRSFKSQTLSEKVTFINHRIATVKDDLEFSEQKLKEFSEQNRQISSPALQLDRDRFTREVEIQKAIFLTLKQQLELAKIEKVQGTSVVQVLDNPQIPLGPSNKNIVKSVSIACIAGLFFGILLGFFRGFINNSDKDERKKLRRMRNFIKKKSKDIILDRRILAIISVMFLFGLPYYLGHESKYPVFFGRYSPSFMIINTVYILTLVIAVGLFIHLSRKKG